MAQSGLRIEIKRNDFAAIAARFPREAGKIVDESLFAVEREWKAGVRVRTGRYVNSIHTEKYSETDGAVVTDVEYAVYQEFGTRYMPAHPALAPAVERERPRFLYRLAHIESELT